MAKIKIKTNQGYKYIKIQKEGMYGVFKKYVSGKNVLDLGCVDFDWKKAIAEKKDFWLHGFICRHAKNCVGVDIDQDEVKSLNEAGYTCVAGNVETIDVGRKFDVITASNLIEHLSNPGLFFRKREKALKCGGGSSNFYS